MTTIIRKGVESSCVGCVKVKEEEKFVFKVMIFKSRSVKLQLLFPLSRITYFIHILFRKFLVKSSTPLPARRCARVGHIDSSGI